MSALQELFSDAVVAVETRESAVDDTRLWPEEAALLGDVVPGRRWDWVMGRRCAYEAMQGLGREPLPVLKGDSREPLWPAGLVGAITHTAGYAAAAVALASDVRSVGIDAEPDEPLPRGVLDRVSLASERTWIADGLPVGVGNRDRLLFTIKEAVYKTWFPLAQRWLGFVDARVELDAVRSRFSVEILVDGPISNLEGRYGSADGIVLAGIELH